MHASKQIIPGNENKEEGKQHENKEEGKQHENKEEGKQHENIDKSKKDAFSRNFPGWNSNNIDRGITDLGGGNCSVQEDHPVIVLIKSVRCKEGILDDKEFQPFYRVKKEDVEKCVSVIKKKMKEEECNS